MAEPEHGRYPANKGLNVSRLAQVPAHWEVRRLRTVADMRVSNVDKHIREGEFPVRLCNYVDVYKNDQITQAMPFMGATASRDEIARFRLERGDVLITKDSEAWDDIGVPSLVVESAYDLLSGYHLALLRPFKEILGAYLAWVLQGRSVAYQFHVRARGVTRYGLTHVGIQSVRIPLPPLSEQRAIVRYLDYVDRRISRYISAKQKLVDLLEEEKQAIINQAVTRGLDTNVRLKPSGVEWLGDVPEHWVMRRGKRLFSPRRELARPNDIQLSATQAYGVIPQDDYERRMGRRIVKISLHLNKRRHVEVDDFVISMRSFQGGLERAWASGCIRSSYIVLRPANEVDVEFFSYVFKSQAYIKALQSTANFIRDGQDLNFNNFCAVDLPFPPTEEQRKIAVDLGEATANIDANIARAHRQIELLQEYRTRLIADVVTGKLDVREAAGELPDDDDDGQDPIEEKGPILDNMNDGSYDASQPTDEEIAIESEVTV